MNSDRVPNWAVFSSILFSIAIFFAGCRLDNYNEKLKRLEERVEATKNIADQRNREMWREFKSIREELRLFTAKQEITNQRLERLKGR